MSEYNERNGLCYCGCGKPAAISRRTSVTTGVVKGKPTRYAAHHSITRRGPRIDFTGKRFNALRVLKLSDVVERDKRGGKLYRWECVCDCGRRSLVLTQNLISGSTSTCGCIRHRKKDSSFTVIFEKYKNGARNRGLTFNLSADDFKRICTGNCTYCGCVPATESDFMPQHGIGFIYNGIDRVDNSIGYELTNCVPCCSICNKAKHTMSVDRFLKWIEVLVKHHSKKWANQSGK